MLTAPVARKKSTRLRSPLLEEQSKHLKQDKSSLAVASVTWVTRLDVLDVPSVASQHSSLVTGFNFRVQTLCLQQMTSISFKLHKSLPLNRQVQRG